MESRDPHPPFCAGRGSRGSDVRKAGFFDRDLICHYANLAAKKMRLADKKVSHAAY